MKKLTRVQTGVAMWSDDGRWYIVQRTWLADRVPEITLFGPPYDTEADAEAACRIFVRRFHGDIEAAGLVRIPTREMN